MSEGQDLGAGRRRALVLRLAFAFEFLVAAAGVALAVANVYLGATAVAIIATEVLAVVLTCLVFVRSASMTPTAMASVAAGLALSIVAGWVAFLGWWYADLGDLRASALIAFAVVAPFATRWITRTFPVASVGGKLAAVLAVDFVVVALVVGGTLGHSPSLPYTTAAVGGVFALLAIFWWLPQWQSSRWPSELGSKDRIELEDKARATVAQLVSGLGLVVTVAITLYSVNQARIAADRTQRDTEEDQASHRFGDAVRQLSARENGKPAITTRLGAIYALERYADRASTNEQDRAAAADATAGVLAAYIRTNAPWAGGRAEHPAPLPSACTSDERSLPGAAPLQPDITAAVFALQRLYYVSSSRFEGRTPPLDLSRSDLHGADLSHMSFDQVNLEASNLTGADLSESALPGARLDGTDARNSCLLDTDLSDATLRGSVFTGAIVCGTGEEGTVDRRRLPREHCP